MAAAAGVVECEKMKSGIGNAGIALSHGSLVVVSSRAFFSAPSKTLADADGTAQASSS